VSATLFVVRHGRTALNADGRLRGRLDVPLDDVGEREAARLGALFAQVPLAIVVTSPLIRARATGEAIAKDAAACLVTDDRLVDRDYGTFAGESRALVEERFGSLDAAPGVESSDAVVVRAAGAVEDLVSASRSRPCLLVAHDAINRVLLTTLVPALGRPEDLAQPTGCWNELRHDRDEWAAVVVGAMVGDGNLPSV
jgi:broad specificity phosphatase PhoE